MSNVLPCPRAERLGFSKIRSFNGIGHVIHTVMIPREDNKTEGISNVMKPLNRAEGWNSLPRLEEHQAVAFLTAFKTNLDWFVAGLWGTATPGQLSGASPQARTSTESLAHQSFHALELNSLQGYGIHNFRRDPRELARSVKPLQPCLWKSINIATLGTGVARLARTRLGKTRQAPAAGGRWQPNAETPGFQVDYTNISKPSRSRDLQLAYIYTDSKPSASEQHP
jgi:hypothetical protein